MGKHRGHGKAGLAALVAGTLTGLTNPVQAGPPSPRLLWEAEGMRVTGSEVADGKLIAQGSSGRSLIAINVASGQVEWQADLGSQGINEVRRIGERVLVMTAKGRLLAFSLARGELLWSQDLDCVSVAGVGDSGAALCKAGKGKRRGNSEITVGLDLAAGKICWRVRDGRFPLVAAAGVVASQEWGENGISVRGRSLATGKILWTTIPFDARESGLDEVAGHFLFSGWEMTCLSPDGRILWQSDSSASWPRYDSSSELVLDGLLQYVTGAGAVRGIDIETGQGIILTSPAPEAAKPRSERFYGRGDLVPGDRLVLIREQPGRLPALMVTWQGQEPKVWESPAQPGLAAAVAGDRLLTWTRDGRVRAYSLGEKEGPLQDPAAARAVLTRIISARDRVVSEEDLAELRRIPHVALLLAPIAADRAQPERRAVALELLGRLNARNALPVFMRALDEPVPARPAQAGGAGDRSPERWDPSRAFDRASCVQYAAIAALTAGSEPEVVRKLAPWMEREMPECGPCGPNGGSPPDIPLRARIYQLLARAYAAPEAQAALDSFERHRRENAGWSHLCPAQGGLERSFREPGGRFLILDGICAPVQIGDYRIGLDMHAHLLWLRRREEDGWGQPVVALTGLPEDANRVAMKSGKLAVSTESLDDDGRILSVAQVAKVDPASVFTDSDGDGLTDLTEAFLGTDPHRADTDGDGEPDGQDAAPSLKADTSDAAKIRAAAVNYALAFFPLCAWGGYPERLFEIGGDAVPMGALATPHAIILPGDGRRIRLSSLIVTPPAASIALTVLPDRPIRLTLRKQGETWRVVDSAFVK